MERLGRYDIVEHVGDDPPWRLFRATSATVGSPYRHASREVVVRFLSFEPWDAAGKELLDEAHLALALDHESIERVLEWEPCELYCVTELVQGWRLDRLLAASSAVPVAAACHVVRQVGEALRYVRRLELAGDLPRAVPRRPIEPASVVVTVEGKVSVRNPGLAILDVRQPALASVSSPRVLERMSPEEAIGLHADHRSDVYHLGLLLHELVTATTQFRRASSFETLAAIRDEPPVALSAFGCDVPGELDDLVVRALAKSPEERHGSAGEVVDALEVVCRDRGWNDGAAAVRGYVERTGFGGRPGPCGFFSSGT